jgi:hypothetical protein
VSQAKRWPVISALGVMQILAWGSSFYLLGVLATPIRQTRAGRLPVSLAA